MIATETKLNGVYVIEPERFANFLRASGPLRRLAALGLAGQFIEANFSYNHQRGTLKKIALASGAARPGQARRVYAWFDLRCGRRSQARLTDVQTVDGHRIVIGKSFAAVSPDGFAHGYLTLEDDSEVMYLVTSGYVPNSGRGARWNDPAFGIRWPKVGQFIINERGRNYTDFRS